MSVSLAIWLSVCFANLVALVATWRSQPGSGLSCLRWYLAFALVADLCTHATLTHFGYRSIEYRNVYYGCDLAVVICGYFVLARLVELAFERSAWRLPGLRLGAILLFTGLATCSALLVYLMRGSISTGSFGHEMEQNFSFLGMIMAVLLFTGLNLMQVPGVRFRRIVLSFSLLYGAGAIIYSLTMVIPQIGNASYYAVPLSSLAGMGLIAYSLLVPEPARPTRTVEAQLGGQAEMA